MIKTFLTHIHFGKDAAKSDRPVTIAGKVHVRKTTGKKIEKHDRLMIRDIVFHFEVLFNEVQTIRVRWIPNILTDD